MEVASQPSALLFAGQQQSSVRRGEIGQCPCAVQGRRRVQREALHESPVVRSETPFPGPRVHDERGQHIAVERDGELLCDGCRGIRRMARSHACREQPIAAQLDGVGAHGVGHRLSDGLRHRERFGQVVESLGEARGGGVGIAASSVDEDRRKTPRRMQDRVRGGGDGCGTPPAGPGDSRAEGAGKDSREPVDERQRESRSDPREEPAEYRIHVPEPRTDESDGRADEEGDRGEVRPGDRRRTVRGDQPVARQLDDEEEDRARGDPQDRPAHRLPLRGRGAAEVSVQLRTEQRQHGRGGDHPPPGLVGQPRPEPLDDHQDDPGQNERERPSRDESAVRDRWPEARQAG